MRDVPGLLAGDGIHEVPGLLDAVEADESIPPLRPEYVLNLLPAPEVVRAFATLGVRVERGVEPALGRGHLARHPRERLLRHTAVLRRAPADGGLGVHRRE